MHLVYEAGWQGLKPRALWVIGATLAGGCAGGGLTMVRSSPAAAALLMVIGLAVFAGAELYTRCYVKRLAFNEARTELYVTTVGLLGGRFTVLRKGDVLAAGSAAGGRGTGASSWLILKVRGRKTPLLVDELGKFADREALDRFLR